jgi:hypothetical protein
MRMSATAGGLSGVRRWFADILSLIGPAAGGRRRTAAAFGADAAKSRRAGSVHGGIAVTEIAD